MCLGPGRTVSSLPLRGACLHGTHLSSVGEKLGVLSVCLAITGKMQRVGSDVGKAGMGRRSLEPWAPMTGPFSMPCIHPALQGFVSGGVGSISSP